MKDARGLIWWFGACGLFTAAIPAAAVAADRGAISIAQEVIEPGERKKFSFIGEHTFEGSFVDFLIFAARGVKHGPTLCVTAGIHGDEINGGIYQPVVELGDAVTQGQVLATIANPLTDVKHEIRAPSAGVVVGMALPQVVLSGYSLFHIGELSDR